MANDAAASAIDDDAPAPGQILRAAREHAGLSQEDIAGKLKLAPRQVAAIELGDWSSLPERTFTRGFMRNYARMVGVDPESLGLDHAPSQPQAASQLKPTPIAIGEITREADHNGPSIARWLVPGLLIAALAAGIAFFQGGAWFGWDVSKFFAASSAPPSLKAAVAAKAEAAAETKAAATGSSGAMMGSTPAANPPALLAVPEAAAPLLPLLPASVATPPAAAALGAVPALIPDTVPIAAAALPAALAAGEKRITVQFKGKSWTEVRSKGEVIFSETAVPGLREFSGKPPLSFIVGNASNVVVTIDGKQFDMSELTRNDVARFRVE